MSAGRRHIYVPDALWSRLLSEAGTSGVRERGRAYSASEFVCNLLGERLPAEPHARESVEPARRSQRPRRPTDGTANDMAPEQAPPPWTAEEVGQQLAALQRHGAPKRAPITKEQQTRRRGK